jgi:hypothetical protein
MTSESPELVIDDITNQSLLFYNILTRYYSKADVFNNHIKYLDNDYNILKIRKKVENIFN